MGVAEFVAPKSALVRLVPSSYERCVRGGSEAIDVALAQEQHAAYLQVLEELGIEVDIREGDDAQPDSCFVEDTAVVLDDWVVVTRPGEPSRRAELDQVAAFLHTRRREVCRIEDPAATLDGGDVLRVGEVLFVGKSRRTNAAGIESLAGFAKRDGLRVVAVDVRRGLHLKSGITVLDAGRVLCDAEAVDLQPFRTHGLECIAAPPSEAANVLALGSAVVVSAAAPRTADLVADLGFDVALGDVSEIQKGDGALTCLSLRLPPRGGWCA